MEDEGVASDPAAAIGSQNAKHKANTETLYMNDRRIGWLEGFEKFPNLKRAARARLLFATTRRRYVKGARRAPRREDASLFRGRSAADASSGRRFGKTARPLLERVPPSAPWGTAQVPLAHAEQAARAGGPRGELPHPLPLPRPVDRAEKMAPTGPGLVRLFKRTAPAFRRCKNQPKRCSSRRTRSNARRPQPHRDARGLVARAPRARRGAVPAARADLDALKEDAARRTSMP